MDASRVPEAGETAGSFVDLLRIEQLDENLFRGSCHAGAPMRAFGGQVAAQALTAAGRTVDAGRQVHSLHGYFLRPGDPRHPIDYQVDRARDGFSYATRRVTAVQHDEVIFTLSASFKYPEPTPGARQSAMPRVPGPEELPDPFLAWAEAAPQDYLASAFRTLDLRFVPADSPGLPPELPGSPQQFVWLRTGSPLPGDDPLLQVCALTYLSDLTLASTTALTVQPHRIQRTAPARIMLASLDHAMWFHRPFRADEWLLFAQRSPSASDGRGLAHGEFYDRQGNLVASAVQEALVRERRP
ncbi:MULTISPECIES: acyl-CoA thioesterase II [unclassified Kitasatospora]|uniref:acyl-CoA thioesterase n=1 Tax=unclassified Kitasatospora TaxID=2633591 RepID=UPI00070BDED9|nr:MULTISPECIES: acyl-CoA thioesterase II [unclassified Kitasatospora]KQV04686.1 acyl-CoA thioesterase II [Kitasatospora sp. Root107]KRB60790.1 acyl-CoA thioesterase II [Kitasatospora sp. Root187]